MVFRHSPTWRCVNFKACTSEIKQELSKKKKTKQKVKMRLIQSLSLQYINSCTNTEIAGWDELVCSPAIFFITTCTVTFLLHVYHIEIERGISHEKCKKTCGFFNRSFLHSGRKRFLYPILGETLFFHRCKDLFLLPANRKSATCLYYFLSSDLCY